MEPYIGEIKIFAFGHIPRGWVPCNGQMMQIDQHKKLFSLLGTQYGGNGITTFAIPDLRGRVPLHFGEKIAQGTAGGNDGSKLTAANLPSHSHDLQVTSAEATSPQAGGNLICSTDMIYAPKTDADKMVTMATTAISTATGSKVSHKMPYIGLSLCMATSGIFPSKP